MNSFLDTTIIIKYLEYDYIKEQLREKCFEYIKSSKTSLLISFVVKDELSRVVLQRKEIYECVLRKIKDPYYEFDYKKTIYLKKHDVLFAQELYLRLKSQDVEKLRYEFDSEISFLNVSLDLFLKNKVDEIEIRKLELDNFIQSILQDYIADFADCRVLTSAIQMQQTRDIFFFVTADRHFAPNEYEFLKDESKLKNYKFPELKNILYENG